MGSGDDGLQGNAVEGRFGYRGIEAVSYFQPDGYRVGDYDYIVVSVTVGLALGKGFG